MGVNVSLTNNDVNRPTPAAPSILRNTITDCGGDGISFYGHSVSSGTALPVTANIADNTIDGCGDPFDGSVAVRVYADRLYRRCSPTPARATRPMRCTSAAA